MSAHRFACRTPAGHKRDYHERFTIICGCGCTSVMVHHEAAFKLCVAKRSNLLYIKHLGQLLFNSKIHPQKTACANAYLQNTSLRRSYLSKRNGQSIIHLQMEYMTRELSVHFSLVPCLPNKEQGRDAILSLTIVAPSRFRENTQHHAFRSFECESKARVRVENVPPPITYLLPTVAAHGKL